LLRDYELVLLVSPQVADDKVTGVVDKVTQFIAGRGGQMGAVNPWGRRRLAYHIKNFEEASYVLASFKMEPAHAKELESSLNISEDVIRHLLVKLES
jgi:small subunit ribosomal protein S6